MKISLSKVFQTLILIFFISLFLDWLLGVFGMPHHLPISHPAKKREIRKQFEFEYYFSTNSQGLREVEIPLEKPPGERRIFVAGDGFVEGVGIAAAEALPALLTRRFSSEKDSTVVRFLNGGLAGRNLLNHCRFFNYVGLQYQLDGVLICLYADNISKMPFPMDWSYFLLPLPRKDATQTLAHWFYPQSAVYWRTRKERIAKYAPIDFRKFVLERAQRFGIDKDRAAEWIKKQPREITLAINRRELSPSVLSHGLLKPKFLKDALDIERQEAINRWNSFWFTMQKMVRIAKHSNLEPAIVFFPSHFQYDSTAISEKNPQLAAGLQVRRSWLADQSTLQQRIQKWCENTEIPFLDLTPVFRGAIATQDSLYYPLDGHWTAKGHKVAAKAIADWIESDAVFPVHHSSLNN